MNSAVMVDLFGLHIPMDSIGVACWTSLAGIVLHELGHAAAARGMGVRGCTFKLARRKKWGVPIWLPSFDVDPAAMSGVSLAGRRLIYAAGTLADLLVATLAWLWAPMLPLGDDVVTGVVLGSTARAALCWINLIPDKALRNDGWRILHPEVLS